MKFSVIRANIHCQEIGTICGTQDIPSPFVLEFIFCRMPFPYELRVSWFQLPLK